MQDGKLAYKVVTPGLYSLGLRSAEPVKYKIKEWTYPESEDHGLWVAKTLSDARGLQKYLKEKYNRRSRIFKCSIGKISYGSSYRIETDRVMLLVEVLN